jgi:APA family basic amino acid/polyamine antiporter
MTTLVKVAALAAIILGAFVLGQGSAANLVQGGPVRGSGLARAVASVILAYLYMMPIGILAQQKEAVARTVMESIAGPAGGTAIILAVMVSVFGALNGNCLARPRVAFAMARDGLTFSFLGKAHPRFATPWLAMVIQGAGAIGMVIVLRDFDTLTTYFVVVEWAALIFAVAAVFVLRRKMADAPRPFRTPAYPWVPLCFVLGTVIGVTAIVWGEIQEGNYSPMYGLCIAAAGFPVHHVWKRWAQGTDRMKTNG